MSVLQINQNVIALNALRNLGQVSRSLSTNVERLSSGLRINRAADDAAGLTISERLQAQINGLKQASQNAQDGISLIQTADGALSETNNILQRIRELAIQAANGILTQSDRVEIQKEVDQLVDEVNTIATSTQFNSKNLLNGQAAALTSVDDPTRTSLVITGDVGKGGNFTIRTTLLSAPTLAVYKTDQMHTVAGTDRVGIINGETTYLNNLAFLSGASNTGLSQMEVQSQTTNGRLLVSAGSAIVSVIATSVAVGGDTIFDAVNSQEISRGVDRIRLIGSDVNGAAVNSSFLLSNTQTWASLATFMENLLFSLPGTDGYVTVAGGKLMMSAAAGVSVVVSNFLFSDVDSSGSKLDLGVTAFSNVAAASNFTTTFIDAASVAITANSTRVVQTIQGNAPTTLGNGSTGQIDIRFGADIAVGSDELVVNTLGANELQQYGIITQTSTPAGDYTFRVSALSNRTYRVTNLDTGSISSTNSIGKAGTAITLDLDSFQGLRLGFDAILVTGETGIIHTSTDNVLQAQNTTQLQSIAAFIDNKVFQGRDSVELSLHAVPLGRSANIQVNKTDTVQDFVGKVSLAIANPNSNTDLNLEEALAGGQYPDLVHFNLTGPARGTISITSPIPGVELTFSGDEGTINALSLFQIQHTKVANYQVSVVGIEDNRLIAQGTSNTGVLAGIITGTEIRFNTNQGFKLDPDGTVNQVAKPYNLDPNSRPTISIASNFVGTNFVHIVPNALVFQIGANQGQSIKLAIGQMDAKAIGIDGILLISQDSAARAVTQVDTAINKVADFRSKLGAIQNRLESTIRNLDVAHQNLAAAESGIRDLNVAEEVVSFTRNQILLQSGTAVLAQANTLPQNALTLLR